MPERQWFFQAWSNHTHLQVDTSVLPGQGPIGRRVILLGLTRRVPSVNPHFSMAAAMLADTDLLLKVPSVTLKTTAPKYRRESRELVFDMPRMGFWLYRSATHGNEADSRWFLERIETVCRRLSIRRAERSGS